MKPVTLCRVTPTMRPSANPTYATFAGRVRRAHRSASLGARGAPYGFGHGMLHP